MIAQIKSYFSNQIDEAQSDPALKIYFFFLTLNHGFTALYWYRQDLPGIISDLNQVYCWPFFTHCDVLNLALAPILNLLLPIYVIGMGITLLAPVKSFKAGWWLLILLEIYKLFLQSVSYKFMGNYHFMPHIITIFYLFFPYKKFWIRTWILSFYLAAASLKLNLEWLSGASLSWKVPFDRIDLLPFAALLGLLTEVTAPFLLTAKNRYFNYAGFSLLFLFHLISYYWVGFFYPTVMLSLLVIFIIAKDENEKRTLHTKPFLIGAIPWVVFVVAQAWVFVNPRAAALGGKERLLSLNMFDASAECYGVFLLHKPNRTVAVSFQNSDLAIRVACDPQIFLEQARHLCENKSPEVTSIEGYLSSRLSSDEQTYSIIEDKNVCQK